jgi:hypothetical protein
MHIHEYRSITFNKFINSIFLVIFAVLTISISSMHCVYLQGTCILTMMDAELIALTWLVHWTPR